MGFFWWDNKSSNDSSDSKNGKIDVPKELEEYISGKNDTTVDTKNFKQFLETNQTSNFYKGDSSGKTLQRSTSLSDYPSADIRRDVIKDDPQLPMISNFKTTYSKTQSDIYKRENGLKESVLTNCSEIQFQLLECLKKRSTLQKITGYIKGDDDCSMLADFLSSCTKLQKMALVMFDYGSLEKVEEMEVAKASVDKVFNNSFKNIKDVEDNKKYMNYTKSLKKERDKFHDMFGK